MNILRVFAPDDETSAPSSPRRTYRDAWLEQSRKRLRSGLRRCMLRIYNPPTESEQDTQGHVEDYPVPPHKRPPFGNVWDDMESQFGTNTAYAIEDLPVWEE